MMENENQQKKSFNGTSQDGRQLKALDFDYVKIDERSFEDLLVFATGFSRLINYYNTNNQVEGDWSDFLNDETIILATMIDSDPGKIEIVFKNNLYKAGLFSRPEKKIAYLQKCFSDIYQLALRFQYWYTKLGEVESFTLASSNVKQEIENAIVSKLSEAFGRIKALAMAFEATSINLLTTEVEFNSFDAVWQLEAIGSNSKFVETTDVKERFALVTTELEAVFQSFYETLLYLKMKAPEYMEQSLRKDNHYPEVALFLAFLKLFKITQGDLNNISQRHLDFYYSQVLKQEPRPAVRDKVYLTFEPYDNIPFADVKKGTLFLAGDDAEGNDILYLADEHLQVNRAKVQKVRNVFIDKRKLNVRGTERTIYNKILSLDIPVQDLTRTPDEKILPKTYAAFGENQEGKGIFEKTMDNARMGFVVNSPILFMKEGLREVTVTFRFSKESYQRFLKTLEELSIAEKTKEDELFVKVFLEAFNISITAENGWLPISRYVILRENKNDTLKIEFDIDSSEPAIVAFSKEKHQGYFSESLPLLKFDLNCDSYIYPYTLLHSLVLDEIHIDTKVSGVKDLVLHNNLGQLSPDSPFYPFGPIPHRGSYLLIGNNEIFQKSLDDLSINIDWFDLPRHNSGLSGHYKEYNLGLDNTSFEVRTSILDGGRWLPESEKEQPTLKLFRSKDNPLADIPKPKVELSEKSLLKDINIKSLKLSPNYKAIEEKLTYSNTARRGFIRLELINPEHAFAHSVYPSILSEVTIKNSRTALIKIANPKIQQLPHPPYAPQIKSISLNYAASAVISLRDRSRKADDQDLRGQVYHLHPFGEQLVYPDTARQYTRLLPEYTYEGSLLLGFSELYPPQTVSVLFEMHDEYSVSSEQDPAIIEWYYLANNEWHYLKPSRILKDETNGFIKTGIVKIEIPQDINRQNTILESDYFWLRATAIRNVEAVSRMMSVYAQVVSATLNEHPMPIGDHLEKPLPAFTIYRSVNNIEGIQSVRQPMESFQGLSHEKTDQYYIRVAEKLRHKQRAVMAWDYERIILDKFPEIYKAACLPNMNSQNIDAPGNVLIVVTPYSNKNSNVREPIASSELLYQIKNYTAGFISPFVKLEVRNPSYERIRIICSVKFIDGYNYGFFLQKLNEELNRYLSNNIIFDQPNVELGGKVNTSDILSFMRTLPYVDFITKFSMVQAARDFNGQYVLLDTARESDTKAFLQASKPWSVLVPAIEHQITVLNDKMEERSLQAGIDMLELGQDFIIE
jgi:hypothetical protein